MLENFMALNDIIEVFQDLSGHEVTFRTAVMDRPGQASV